jgi:hypothetical protein
MNETPPFVNDPGRRRKILTPAFQGAEAIRSLFLQARFYMRPDFSLEEPPQQITACVFRCF